ARQGIMTLDAVEFVRRFLMHVLPSGFVRIRHYGLLANRHRQEKLQRCRELLHVEQHVPLESQAPVPAPEGQEPMSTAPCGQCCPSCGRGRMVWVEGVEPARPSTPFG